MNPEIPSPADYRKNLAEKLKSLRSQGDGGREAAKQFLKEEKQKNLSDHDFGEVHNQYLKGDKTERERALAFSGNVFGVYDTANTEHQLEIFRKKMDAEEVEWSEKQKAWLSEFPEILPTEFDATLSAELIKDQPEIYQRLNAELIEAVNRGATFRLKYDEADELMGNPEYIDEYDQLYYAMIVLEDCISRDGKLMQIPFPLFAQAMEEPSIRNLYALNTDESGELLGIKPKEVYVSLKQVFGEQFAGIFGKDNTNYHHFKSPPDVTEQNKKDVERWREHPENEIVDMASARQYILDRDRNQDGYASTAEWIDQLKFEWESVMNWEFPVQKIFGELERSKMLGFTGEVFATVQYTDCFVGLVLAPTERDQYFINRGHEPNWYRLWGIRHAGGEIGSKLGGVYVEHIKSVAQKAFQENPDLMRKPLID